MKKDIDLNNPIITKPGESLIASVNRERKGQFNMEEMIELLMAARNKLESLRGGCGNCGKTNKEFDDIWRIVNNIDNFCWDYQIKHGNNPEMNRVINL